VNSKERMIAALTYQEHDHIPCSFMMFFNEYFRTSSIGEFIENQVNMGLDPYVHVGHLKHSISPEASCKEWSEKENGFTNFCRQIDTPKGPLLSKTKQVGGWPKEGDFPLFNDWLVTRSKKPLVDPEQDLEKLKYFFGPFRDEDIEKLRESGKVAKKLADKYGLLQLGGWKGSIDHNHPPIRRGNSDGGVMGCDCMAWLSGYEDIMVLSLTQPEIIAEYANIISEWNKQQISIYMDVTDCDIVWRRAWYETTEFWTPQAYRDIIAPTLKKEAELVHQAGNLYGYIITSAFLPLLDDIIATGVDVLVGLDPAQGKGTEIIDVKKRSSEKGMALWGGVSGAMTVELGTAAETRAAVIEAMDTLGTGGGFILSPVDNLREDTPNAQTNTEVFIDTWKNHR
jgi:hypothetical protein